MKQKLNNDNVKKAYYQFSDSVVNLKNVLNKEKIKFNKIEKINDLNMELFEFLEKNYIWE